MDDEVKNVREDGEITAESSDISESEASESDFDVELSEEARSDSDSVEDHRDLEGRIVPYMYEPELDSDDDGNDGNEIPGVHNDNDDLEGRLGNTDWCSCGGCGVMPTVKESVCCKEIPQVVQRMDEFVLDVDCILEHPGFNTVCLDRWVLDTAYFQYRQQYGQGRHGATENQKYRHCGYRQLARWCWGFLGRSVRVPLPSCAVLKIREKYPSAEYRGYQEL